jgi:transcriptional regulator with XRE-family HTH domain
MNMIAFPQGGALKTIGARIAIARAEKGYSLDDVAETTGLTMAEVAAIEVGEGMDQGQIRRVAAMLGIPADEIG